MASHQEALAADDSDADVDLQGADGAQLEPLEGDPRDSPSTTWPLGFAPLALIAGIVLAAVGSFAVDLPALAFGVKLSTEHTPPGLTIADTIVQDVAFILAAVYCAKIGGRTVRSWMFGLRTPGAGWRSAVLMMVLLIVAYLVISTGWDAIFHPSREKLLDQLGTDQGTLLLLLSALLTCVIAPIGEEFLFRGFMFTAFRNRIGTLPAAILTGILFGGVHAGSAPALDLVPLGFLGFGLCLLYRYSGSLYPSIVVHSINNCVAFSELEHWQALQGRTLLLFTASMLTIASLVAAFKRIGLIAPTYAVSRSGA